jgi:D-beta-D-heptose 7-phosphate kinase/D-beta-D-heptose 1-phosphate adenosyltransferase
VIFSSGDVVFSSTQILGEMRQSPALQQAKLAGMCRRQGIELQRLVRCLSQIVTQRVTVVGDLVLEKHIHCDVQDLSAGGPAPRLRPIATCSRLIGAAHIARCVRRLGAEVRLIAPVGVDAASKRIGEQLTGEGLRTRLFACRDEILRRTCYLADDQALFQVEQAPACPTDSVQQRNLLAEIENGGPMDLLILADLGYDLLTRPLAEAICRRARSGARCIAVGAGGPAGALTKFSDVDLACPTERQLRRSVNDVASGLSAVAAQLVQSTRTASMIVRLGRRGVVVFDGREMLAAEDRSSLRLRSEWLPAFCTGGVDGESAGAVLLAVASLALAAGAPPPSAAYLANAAAGLAERDGEPYCPGPGELVRALAGRPELASRPAEITADPAPPPITERLRTPKRVPPSRQNVAAV